MQPAPCRAAVRGGPLHDGAHRQVRQATRNKSQAASRKHQASSGKHQALQLIPSFKPQAASFKRQAASDKVRHRGAWIKYRAALLVGLDQDVRVCRMLDMEGYLMRREGYLFTFCYFQFHCKKATLFSVSN